MLIGKQVKIKTGMYKDKRGTIIDYQPELTHPYKVSIGGVHISWYKLSELEIW